MAQITVRNLVVVRFEVVMGESMKKAVFWSVALCKAGRS
jgi:hypothetical protein